MKQIICLSHSPWSARPNRTQQLLTRLNDVQILFFEPPSRTADPKTKQGLRVRPNVTVYPLPPLILEDVEHPVLHRCNQVRIARYISKIMHTHNFKHPLLWCTTPANAFLVDQLPYRGLIYDCHEEWDDFPLQWESDLTFAADVVFAASPGLKRRLSPCNDNVAVLPNGANHRMFLRDGLTPPSVVSSLRAPVFARVGDITADLELQPLIYTAQLHPEWTFLLLGRVNHSAVRTLSSFPNVVLAGSVPAVELPDYLSGCNILFDLIHSSQRGCDIVPSRIYEYLATGKPIVAMVEPEEVEVFPDVIYTAYDANGFLRRCQTALAESNPYAAQRRLEYARKSSWSCRAEEISRILESTGLF